MADRTGEGEWEPYYNAVFGAKLRRKREAMKPRTSQETLAHRIGKSWATISDIERGLRRPSEPIIEALADVFGCEPFDLYPTRRDLFPPGGKAHIGYFQQIAYDLQDEGNELSDMRRNQLLAAI